MAKSAGYYQGCNEALLAAVPAQATIILEVGCGEGILGGRLKAANPQATVLGIEREPEVADRARRRLDQVFTLDVQNEDPPLAPASLDCILFGDVLEHLIDPGEVLLRYRKFLKPEGIVLCSIPNVQHHSIVQALIKGDFQYAPDGLLDATHLRFFTYSTIIKLGSSFNFWDLLAGLTPPPDWKVPEGLAKVLAELSHPVSDVIEEKIYKDG